MWCVCFLFLFLLLFSLFVCLFGFFVLIFNFYMKLTNSYIYKKYYILKIEINFMFEMDNTIY